MRADARLLQDGLTLNAERRPDRRAIVCGADAVTYAQLDQRSNQLARALIEAGCRRGDRVCLIMPKSVAAIESIEGILKADCVYVPIDPASPAIRIAKIIEQCEPRAVLGAGPAGKLLDEVAKHCPAMTEIAIGWMDVDTYSGRELQLAFSRTDYAARSTAPLESRNGRHDPAYIMFTSGSTGVPKGVVISHGNVLAFLGWALKYFGLNSSDRMSGHPPLHFDLSVFDIFGASHAGAELHLVPHELNLLPHKLADFIRTSELTQWFSVPSLLNFMAKFDALKPDDFPTLKRVLWCGEVLPTPALIYWMKRLPHVTFDNLYGPTEATIASSYFRVPACPDDEAAQIPIGQACDEEELLVLNDRLDVVPTGVVGDLYIRGAGLSQGYWRDPEKTNAVFLPNPLTRDPTDRIYKTGDLASVGGDGQVYMHGRSDTQIKSRGYRIELGEIEAALHALGVLRDCAVVVIPAEGFEGMTICCMCVPATGVQVDAASLKRLLARRLPSYMIPTLWRIADALPQNASGKTDRVKIREEFKATSSS